MTTFFDTYRFVLPRSVVSKLETFVETEVYLKKLTVTTLILYINSFVPIEVYTCLYGDFCIPLFIFKQMRIFVKLKLTKTITTFL